MILKMDFSIAKGYANRSQIARVVTEAWVSENMYCPRCGNRHIFRFGNNRPVADFFCDICYSEYELKSKDGAFGNKVNDGTYDTMMTRIQSDNNPDLLCLSYSSNDESVHDVYCIPKHFFVPNIIEKRKPLSPTARRANWVDCNILLSRIPKQGVIPIVKDGYVYRVDEVVQRTKASDELYVKDIRGRGWLLDVLLCVNQIPDDDFTLEEVYAFEKHLASLHPENNNVRPKIRQQLQLLRNRGCIEFLGNGKYRRIGARGSPF